MPRHIINALIALTLLAIESTAIAGDKLRLAYPDDAGSHVAAREILHRAYTRLGIDVEMVGMPWKRALLASNNGIFDGEVARIPVIEDLYPNLVRVPVPLYALDIYAYTLAPSPDLTQWSDLEGKRLGMELGAVIFEVKTRGMNRVMHDDVGDLVAMLKRGGIDAIINNHSRRMVRAPFSLHRSKRLSREYFFHYLHVSRTDQIAAVTQVLADMETSGEIARIIAALEEPSAGRGQAHTPPSIPE